MADDMSGPVAQTYVSIRADLKTLDAELGKAKAATEATVAQLQAQIEALSTKTAASIAGLAKKAQVDTGKAFLLMQTQGSDAMAGFAANVKKRMLESIEASNRARDSFREAFNAGMSPGKTPLAAMPEKATEAKKALAGMDDQVHVSARELKKMQYVAIAASGGLGELGHGAQKVTNILSMMAFHGFTAIVGALAVSTVAILKAASAWGEYSASVKKAKEDSVKSVADINEAALRRRDERQGTNFAAVKKAGADLAKEQAALRAMEEEAMGPFRKRLAAGEHFNPEPGSRPITPTDLKKRLKAAGVDKDFADLSLEDLSLALPNPLAAIHSVKGFSEKDMREAIPAQRQKVEDLRKAMHEAGEDLRNTAVEQGKRFREAMEDSSFAKSIEGLDPEFQRAAEKIREQEKKADDMVRLSLDPAGKMMDGGVSRDQADEWLKKEKDRISAEAVAKISAEDKAKADKEAAEALKERNAEEKKNAALAGEWAAQASLERDLASVTDDLTKAILRNSDAKRRAREQLGPNATEDQVASLDALFAAKNEALIADAMAEAEKKREEIRKEADAELFDLTATDQEREQRQFADHYTKLLDLAEAYGVDVTALRKKIAAVVATIGAPSTGGGKQGMNPATGKPWTEDETRARKHALYSSGMKQGKIRETMEAEGFAVDEAAAAWGRYGSAVSESLKARKAWAEYQLAQAKKDYQTALFASGDARFQPGQGGLGVIDFHQMVVTAKIRLDEAQSNARSLGVKAASGLSARVGGTGASDSKMVSLALSPGELIDVRKPGTGGEGSVVEIHNHGARIEQSVSGDGRRTLLLIEGALARRARRGGILGRTMLDLAGSRRKGVPR